MSVVDLVSESEEDEDIQKSWLKDDKHYICPEEEKLSLIDYCFQEQNYNSTVHSSDEDEISIVFVKPKEQNGLSDSSSSNPIRETLEVSESTFPVANQDKGLRLLAEKLATLLSNHISKSTNVNLSLDKNNAVGILDCQIKDTKEKGKLRLKACFFEHYKTVFDDKGKNICLKMGDLLLLTMKAAQSYESRMVIANQLSCQQLLNTEAKIVTESFKNALQHYRVDFVRLFYKISRKIYNCATVENRIILLTAWFLRMFLRVTTLSPEFTEAIEKTKLMVIILLSVEITSGPQLLKCLYILLPSEEAFDTCCSLILGFMKHCDFGHDQKTEEETEEKPKFDLNLCESYCSFEDDILPAVHLLQIKIYNFF